MSNTSHTTYEVSDEFKNAVLTETEQAAKLENATTLSNYYLEQAAKCFVKSRLYVGLAVRKETWSWCSSDDCRSGVTRQVLALNLVTGEVSWVNDGGGEVSDYSPSKWDTDTKGNIPMNATPEQRKQALEWLKSNRGTTSDRDGLAAQLRCCENSASDKANQAYNSLTEIRKGSRVKVTRGRKVPVGTTGTVVWVGNTNYGYRVGITPSGRMVNNRYTDVVWTALNNVELNDPALIEQANRAASEAHQTHYTRETAAAYSRFSELMERYAQLLA